MMNTTLVTDLLALGGFVFLVWLTCVIVRLQGRRRRLLRNLGVVSEHWLTVHRTERW